MICKNFSINAHTPKINVKTNRFHVLHCHTRQQLEIYEAFLEEVLKQTSESHCDYAPLGTALQELGDLKEVSFINCI